MKIVKVCVLLCVSSVLILNQAAFANGPVEKLGRGLANIVTFPLEIPREIADVNSENGMAAAATVGLIGGLVKACIRVGVGVFEVITFPLAYPENYDPILTDPEFFFE